MEIGRLLTAMVTPFDEQGKVDFDLAQRLAIALVESGSEGVVVAGTTGEAPTLTDHEKIQLFLAVKNAVGETGVVLAGTGTYDTRHSVYLSQQAERMGVDALLLTAPYYNRPPQEGLYQHFDNIAASVDLPCILYNIPGRTGVNITAETQIRLADVGNIIGVKEASGDLIQIVTVIRERPDFKVWAGDDQMLLPILALGGYGGICVTSHLLGFRFYDLIDSFERGENGRAEGIHGILLPLMQVLMTISTNPIPIKVALNGIGVKVGGVRLPLVMPDEVACQRIIKEVRKHNIDLKWE